jgi:hypothetical protein
MKSNSLKNKHSKGLNDKVIISSEYYENDRPSFICSFCNQVLIKLTDAGQNNTTYYITSKEFTICKTIADTLWDQGDALYIEILARIKSNDGNPFESPEDIEDTIKVLIEKRIVRSQTEFIHYGDGKKRKFRPEKVLKLRDKIEAEVHQILSKEFNSSMNQAFFDSMR